MKRIIIFDNHKIPRRMRNKMLFAEKPDYRNTLPRYVDCHGTPDKKAKSDRLWVHQTNHLLGDCVIGCARILWVKRNEYSLIDFRVVGGG